MLRKKILLIEDSPLQQRVAKTVLQQWNCLLDIADTGEDAVALCQKNHYDLIVMDIDLPGIDGLMATRLIREQEQGQSPVPIVALAAHDDPARKRQALSVGMNDYLVKPLTMQSAQKILTQYGGQTSEAANNRTKLLRNAIKDTV